MIICLTCVLRGRNMNRKNWLNYWTIIVILCISTPALVNSNNNFKNASLLTRSHSLNNRTDAIKVTNDATQPTYDQLSHYHLNVTFNESSSPLPSITGTLNLSYLNTENQPISNLDFNLWPNGVQNNSLIINSVKNESNADLIWGITNYTYLQVSLTQPVPIGTRKIIVINFVTYLPFVEDRFGFQNASSYFGKTLYAFTNWYPILAVFENNSYALSPYTPNGESFYADMAYYDVNLKVNKSLIVASGGLQESNTSDSTYTYYNYTLSPAREISFVISPDFLLTTTYYQGIQLNSYYFPEDQLYGVLANNISANSLGLFSNLFQPYPYQSMSVIDFPFYFGGMEYTGLVQISHDFYNASSVQKTRFELVIVHEISHDWNTYLVADNPYVDPWLDEAWAMYSELLYFEQYNDTMVSELRTQFINGVNYRTYNGIPGVYPPFNYPISLGMNFFDSGLNSFAYGSTVYYKGALVIDLLRTYMGDQAFFQAEKDYYNTFSYKTVNTAQFINSFESSSNLNLDWFFNAFVYDSTYIDHLVVSQIQGTYNLTDSIFYYSFNLLQLSNYTYYPIKIPIQISINNNYNVSLFAWLNSSSSIVQGYFAVPATFITSNSIVSIAVDPTTKLLRNPTDISGSTIVTEITTPPTSDSSTSQSTTSTSNTDTSQSSSESTSSETNTGSNPTNSPGFTLLYILPLILVVLLKKRKK